LYFNVLYYTFTQNFLSGHFIKTEGMHASFLIPVFAIISRRMIPEGDGLIRESRVAHPPKFRMRKNQNKFSSDISNRNASSCLVWNAVQNHTDDNRL
jgi:hypothetical protein